MILRDHKRSSLIGYFYDLLGREVLFHITIASQPQAGEAIYKYDPFGRRIQKNVNGNITNFVYDGDYVIAEYDGSGTLLRKFIYGLWIDEPVLMDDGTSKYFYHFDGLGSVTALSDLNSNLTESYEYDIFGGVRSSLSSVGNPYYFTGRRYDSETGLYYYRARYYSPAIGRFLQTDPVGYYAGMNLFAYCGNNPISWIDPYGLSKDKDKYAPEEPEINWEPKNKPPEDPAPKSPEPEKESKTTTPNDPTKNEPTKKDPEEEEKEPPWWKKLYPNKDWWKWRKKQHEKWEKKSLKEKKEYIASEYLKGAIIR